jgi:hypothetical protein
MSPAADAAIAGARAEIEAYRASWRAACDPSRGPADVAALLSDAEALVADVRVGRAVARLASSLGAEAPWPLPGLHRHGEGVDVDWAAFASFPRGSVEDVRFFRGLGKAAGPDGDPIWLGPAAPDGAPCLRLAETSWIEVAQGIEEMERARSGDYARRAAILRERLAATLDGLARGGPACGCVRGDPLPALDALAGKQAKVQTPARRALIASAAAAAEALRRGKARVSWLRETAGAPATGCGAGPR